MNQIVTFDNLLNAIPLAQTAARAAMPITVAFGDGTGPEIMVASLRALLAAGANIAIEPIEIGEKVYRSGNTAGIRKVLG